jgi:hypothetical protein
MIGEGVGDEVCDVALEENGAIRDVAGNERKGGYCL